MNASEDHRPRIIILADEMSLMKSAMAPDRIDLFMACTFESVLRCRIVRRAVGFRQNLNFLVSIVSTAIDR
jgi:hypothetical protein